MRRITVDERSAVELAGMGPLTELWWRMGDGVQLCSAGLTAGMCDRPDISDELQLLSDLLIHQREIVRPST